MPRPRRLVLAALGAFAFLSPVGCRTKPSGTEGGAEVPAPPEPARGDDQGEGGPAGADARVEAGTRFRDAEPRVVVDADGPIEAACSGMEIALAVAVVDRRCAIGSGRAKQLRAALERDGGSDALLPLKQEGKVGADGRVTLRLLNTGSVPLTLPLSFSAKLPAFTALAEDERHSLFELEAPRLEVAAGGPEALAANDRPHFARIVLAAGGAALATVTIRNVVVRALGRGADAGVGPETCADGGACARLPKGRYTLHVGELLADVEAGAPARVIVDLP